MEYIIDALISSGQTLSQRIEEIMKIAVTAFRDCVADGKYIANSRQLIYNQVYKLDFKEKNYFGGQITIYEL